MKDWIYRASGKNPIFHFSSSNRDQATGGRALAAPYAIFESGPIDSIALWAAHRLVLQGVRHARAACVRSGYGPLRFWSQCAPRGMPGATDNTHAGEGRCEIFRTMDRSVHFKTHMPFRAIYSGWKARAKLVVSRYKPA
jgi:hypothetical protein